MVRELPTGLGADSFAADHLLGIDRQGNELLWSGWVTLVERFSTELAAIHGTRVAIYHRDGLHLLALMAALWQQGKTAVIPANTLPETLEYIKQHTDAFAGELPEYVAEVNPAARNELSSQPALVMFTSGSTGKPAAIEKTFNQLNAEIAVLEETWGDLYPDCLYVGTVSHHHMYGLPFRLLWPVLTGKPVAGGEITYFEQLEQYAGKSLVLISSPAHLENIPGGTAERVSPGSVQGVFSAGAPLDVEVAKNAEQEFGAPVTEIYGSTETGAVSCRRTSTSAPWQPLANVQVKSVDGHLAILSPMAADGVWVITEDLVEFEESGGFFLRGRNDQILKIGGKRVSSRQIEVGLNAHEWVSEARVLLLPERKSRVGAVVALNEEGRRQLIDLGKRAVSTRLAEALRDGVERVAWPRYWRFVDILPKDSQGKVTAAQLKRLFAGNSEKQKFPQVVEEMRESEYEYRLQLRVPHDLLYLEGHFPGQPILPGVVQVGWAIHYGKTYFPIHQQFSALEVLKFQRVVRPDELVTLNLSWNPEKAKLSFSFTGEQHAHSSGRVAFRDGG